MNTEVSPYLRFISTALSALFILSAAFNLGLSLSIGAADLRFSLPSADIAGYELTIAILLITSAVYPNIYLTGGGYILATVGIAEGLLSADVQGLARNIHEIMVPVDVLGLAMLVMESVSIAKDHGSTRLGSKSAGTIKVLQVFLGALVTLGGAAFTLNGSYPAGTVLGGIHLSIGMLDLCGAYAFMSARSWSRKFLIITDVLTVVYSGFSETLAEIYAYLPQGINDALVGTIIAIAVGCILVYLLIKTERV